MEENIETIKDGIIELLTSQSTLDLFKQDVENLIGEDKDRMLYLMKQIELYKSIEKGQK